MSDKTKDVPKMFADAHKALTKFQNLTGDLHYHQPDAARYRDCLDQIAKLHDILHFWKDGDPF